MSDAPMSARDVLRPFLDALGVPRSALVEAVVTARYESFDPGTLLAREDERVEAVVTLACIDAVPAGYMIHEPVAGWKVTGTASSMHGDAMVYEMMLTWSGADRRELECLDLGNLSGLVTTEWDEAMVEALRAARAEAWDEGVRACAYPDDSAPSVLRVNDEDYAGWGGRAKRIEEKLAENPYREGGGE